MLNKRGYTLMEILVTMSIFAIIGTLTWRFIATGFLATTFNMEQQEAISNARKAIDIMTKEIRGANNSEQGSYPLSRIDDQDFIYYSDLDEDDQVEQIRYFLTGTTLLKIVTEPGALNDYSGAGATSTVSLYVNNDEEAIFSYYDSDYVSTSAINEIRLINIKLKINVTPTISPRDYYVETDVNLRNLKDNL